MQRLIIALAVTVSLQAAIKDPVRTDSGMVRASTVPSEVTVLQGSSLRGASCGRAALAGTETCSALERCPQSR